MRHRNRQRVVLLGALAAVLLPALAQAAVGTCAPATAGTPSTCLTNGLFDTILGMVENATANWVSIGAGKTGIGWVIFTSLATLELIWWGITNALRKNDLGEWFSSLFLKMLELSFFGFVVATAPTWMPYIPQQFEMIGQKFLAASQFGAPPGAATVPLTPSGIMSEAWNVEKILWNGGNPTRVAGAGNPTTGAGTSPTNSNCSFGHPINCVKQAAENAMEGMIASLATIITSLLLYLGFGLVALQLMMTLMEMYMVLGIGSIMLGFLGSRWTVQFGERYASYAASVGVKLLTTYGVSAVMVHMAQQDAAWLNQLGAGQVLAAPDMMALGTSGLLGGIMALTIPSVAGSIMGGAASLGLSHLTSAGGGIARAGAATALGAAAGGVAAKAALGRLAALTSVSGTPAGGIGGAGSSVGGFKGGAGAIAATPPPPGGATGTRGAGGAAGAGMGAGGKAAGAGVAAASKAAGAALSAVPGLQPVGAAVSAAGQAAGKGVEAAGKAAGKGVEGAGKAASAARGAAGAATTGSGASPAGGTPFSGPGKGGGDAPSTGSPPGTGGADQLSAPDLPQGAKTFHDDPEAKGEGGKKEPSAASKLWQQAQHHAGQAHRGLPHEGGVSAPGLRFGHSED
jgi:type IV secretion system protein TrbL